VTEEAPRERRAQARFGPGIAPSPTGDPTLAPLRRPVYLGLRPPARRPVSLPLEDTTGSATSEARTSLYDRLRGSDCSGTRDLTSCRLAPTASPATAALPRAGSAPDRKRPLLPLLVRTGAARSGAQGCSTRKEPYQVRPLLLGRARASGAAKATSRALGGPDADPSEGTTDSPIIRGRDCPFETGLIDARCAKSDGFPTYHLAVVVDDHFMGISTFARRGVDLEHAKHVCSTTARLDRQPSPPSRSCATPTAAGLEAPQPWLPQLVREQGYLRRRCSTSWR